MPVETPWHGDRGESFAQDTGQSDLPAAFTIALSRQAGARGMTIARRVGRQLGWQVYSQELIDYLAQEGPPHEQLLAEASPENVRWADDRLVEWRDNLPQEPTPSVIRLARLLWLLGAQGDAIIVGRGAGFLLPTETTLHVRIYASEAERVAYLGSLLRLPHDEAVREAHQRDAARADFLTACFGHHPDEPDTYDLLLNSARLGESVCADLIAQAVRLRQEARVNRRPGSLPDLDEVALPG